MNPQEVISKRHPDWTANHVRWRWLRESFEGGDQYRRATYGTDIAGYPRQNLIRHKHEVAVAGSIAGRNLGAQEDRNFWLRLERTPVPSMMSEAIETHLSEIYSRKIERKGGGKLEGWWKDVNGKGVTIDAWMADQVAPYLMTLGCLDLMFGRPVVPPGEEIRTRADEMRLGLDRCLANIILPECVVWWRTEPYTGHYLEVLVEYPEPTGPSSYIYMNAKSWVLIGPDGRATKSIDHGFGRVPMVRVFDRRKPTCDGVGVPRYEPIAELQREAYNRESELVLTGAMLSHPQVQGPEDYIQDTGDIPIGPGFMLPKKRCTGGAGQVTYEGFEWMDPPATGAESNRADLDRIREQVDRAAKLTKPAGASGTGKGTVSQSGVSKALDQKSGNALLGRIAAILEGVEKTAAEFVGVVLKEETDQVVISYPRSFNLLTAEELAGLAVEIQGIVAAAGKVPLVEAALLKLITRTALSGSDDAELAAMAAEIDEAVQDAAASMDRESESLGARTLPFGQPAGQGLEAAAD